MRKQITVTDEEINIIQEIAKQIGAMENGEKVSFVLHRMVRRWQKAKEQRQFKKGLQN